MSEPPERAHGVYVHIPWCRARCPYCAFYVVPLRGTPEWQPFVARVLEEYEQRRDTFSGQPETLFFGGGTPSRLPPEAIAALVWGISPAAGAEISIEVNPEDIDERWLDGVISAGIDRISLGVQSLRGETAGRLGRAHTSRRSKAAIAEVVRSGVRSWSADLVFAVPGQREDDLWEDLSRLLELDPPHVSLYGLTIEPGTRFERAASRGVLPGFDEDDYGLMYEGLVERLEAAGYQRYEVSNFAKPGHQCRHNRLYWTDAPYMGLGPSAHGYAPSGERWVNASSLADYLRSEDPTERSERPDPEQAAADLYISAMRTSDGLDLAYLLRRTSLQPDPGLLDRLEAGGLIEREGTRIRLARRGFLVSDAVISRLVDASRPRK